MNIQSSIPQNFSGFQYARGGAGYIGISSNLKFNEYIETKLIKPLQKDSVYYVEFYVSMAEKSGKACNKIGACFSEKEIKLNTIKSINLEPQIIYSDFISDTSQWIKVSGYYNANGKERYLIVGCFSSEKTDYQSIEYNKRSYYKSVARYFIDDITVKPKYIKESILTDSLIENQKIEFDSTEVVILKDIIFEFGKWELTKNEIPILDSLADYLDKRIEFDLLIIGHTDSIGNVQSNLTLSLRRAEKVKEYLIDKGILPERIVTKGLGSSMPIASNKTDEGRAINRRVEIQIVRNK